MRQACSAYSLLIVTFFGLSTLFAQEREKGRSAEAEAGQRRSAEAERGARRSAEGERGARRSVEGEGAHRPTESERGARQSAEGGRATDPLQEFKPQTKREAALLQMIVQLRREVATLRAEVGRRRTTSDSAARDSATPRRIGGGGESRFTLPARWQKTKEGRVFLAYDKNRDGAVTLDEWLAMTNGNVNSTRRALQTKRFNEAEPNGDGKFTPGEFIYWYSKGRQKAADAQRNGRTRDGERE